MKVYPPSVCVNVVTRDGNYSPDIPFWLEHMQVPHGNLEIKALCNRDNAVAHNATLYRCMARAKAAGLEWCLLVDSDVAPICGDTDQLFDAPYDLTCVKCATARGAKSWQSPSVFHAQMWIARLATLEKIPRPAFRWLTTYDNSLILACFCNHLAMQAIAQGFTTGHVGWCTHVPSEEIIER